MSRKSSSAAKILMAMGLVTAAAASAPAAQASHVTPSGIECATYDSDANAVKERLVTVNTYNSIETIPIGANNFFYPDLDDRGQPAQFLPGRQSWDIKVPVSSDTLYWGLAGNYLEIHPTAENARFGRPCADSGPQITSVQPTALERGRHAQRLTIFGQGLSGSDVSIAGDGVHATAVEDSSDQRLDVDVDVDSDAELSARDLLVTDRAHLQTGCRHCVALEDPEPAAPEVTEARSDRVAFHPGVATAIAVCPSGLSAAGGGHVLTGLAAAAVVTVVESRPLGPDRWRVTVRSTAPGSNARFLVFAMCV
jgi:hypothetical protein